MEKRSPSAALRRFAAGAQTKRPPRTGAASPWVSCVTGASGGGGRALAAMAGGEPDHRNAEDQHRPGLRLGRPAGDQVGGVETRHIAGVARVRMVEELV